MNIPNREVSIRVETYLNITDSQEGRIEPVKINIRFIKSLKSHEKNFLDNSRTVRKAKNNFIDVIFNDIVEVDFLKV